MVNLLVYKLAVHSYQNVDEAMALHCLFFFFVILQDNMLNVEGVASG